MKIVREHLNEIRQDKESAFDSLGIGKVGAQRAWRSFQSFPSSIKSLAIPMTEKFNNEIYHDFNVLLKKRGVVYENMMWMGSESIYNFTIENMLSDWVEQWNFNKVVLNIGGRWGHRHTYVTWDDYGKIGMISVSNHDTLGRFDGYFIENK
jgi:hypothetical protein